MKGHALCNAIIRGMCNENTTVLAKYDCFRKLREKTIFQNIPGNNIWSTPCQNLRQ